MRTNVCLIFVFVSKIVRTNVWESLGLWKSESHRQQRPPPRAECKEAGDVTSKMFIQSQADKMSSTNWPLYIFLNQGPQKNLETDACCQWPKNYGVDSKYSSWFPVAWLQNPVFQYFSNADISNVDQGGNVKTACTQNSSIWLCLASFQCYTSRLASQQGSGEE